MITHIKADAGWYLLEEDSAAACGFYKNPIIAWEIDRADEDITWLRPIPLTDCIPLRSTCVVVMDPDGRFLIPESPYGPFPDVSAAFAKAKEMTNAHPRD